MKNKILVNGMVWGRKELLVSPIDYDDFVNEMLEALGREKKGFRAQTDFGQKAVLSRASFEASFRTPDLNNPQEVKWMLLLPPRSQATEQIATALKPLVDHRQGQVLFSPEPPAAAEPEDWIVNHYSQMDDSERPYYVLLAGSPETIPFRFQYTLDVQAAVGRLSFERTEDYARYAQKVVDFETRDDAFVAKRTLFFATEHSPDDATHFSRCYMADKLVEMVQEKGIPSTYLAGGDATLANLISAFGGKGETPALVYTATHGLGVPGQDEEVRRRLQGAIVCQDYDGRQGVLAADLVPTDSFAHGSIMFSFACYGAGTPRDSDFFQWIKDPGLLNCRPKQDFIAALPQKLLAHPKGPLAFIGHLDPAWLYSFADPNHLADDKGWGSRMAPFRQAVDQLLQGATVGYAVKRFNELYATISVKLTNIENQFQSDVTRGGDPQWNKQLIDTWMTRNDTQNFIVLGDPAVKAKLR